MFRLKLAAVVLGAMFAYFGVQEFRVSQGTSVEPVDVELASIEAGDSSENNHIRLGEHFAVYAGSVYQYRQGKYETGEPTGTTDVDYAYYPIISAEHPFFTELATLADKHGSLDDVPDAEWPAIDSFSVIVKTKRFDTIGAIPDSMNAEDSVQGLVINLIEGLDSEEESLLRQSFPKVDVNKVLIVEDGRQPASAMKSLGMTAGGVLVSLAGAAGFLIGRPSAA